MLARRNKLIKIADRSEMGWKTVEEYESDNLAEDSADEKRIRAAEKAASAKKAKQQKEKAETEKQKVTAKPTSSSRALTTQHPPRRDNISTRTGSSAYPRGSHNTQGSSSRFRSGYTTTSGSNFNCFGCGERGHLRRDCPYGA